MLSLVKNKFSLRTVVLASVSAMISFNSAIAGEYPQLEQKLDSLSFVDYEISQSPIDDLVHVVTKEGVFLADKTGNYIIQGNLYKLSNGSFEDITNKVILHKLAEQKTIKYKATNEKHKVYVFTDITCHYCAMLHKSIDKYTDLGITVEYLAFPRNGDYSNVAKRMESIWQSSDPKKNITLGFNGDYKKTAPVKIVSDQYNLGLMFNVNGTPNIITANGKVIPGYLPPEKLLEELER